MSNFKQEIFNLKQHAASTDDKKIYLGIKAFDSIMKALGVIYGCTEIKTPSVTFVRVPYAQANAMFTEDAELGAVLEMIDKELNGNEKT